MFPKNALSGASLAAVALLCCVALRARAGEKTDVDLDLTVEQDYDSNVFAREHDTIGSAVTIVRPTLAFQSESPLGFARVEGWLSDHTFWSETGLNGTDRGIGADLDRTIFPRFALFGSGSYQRVAPHNEIRGPNIVTTSPGAPGVPGQPVIEPGELISGSVPNVDLGQGEAGVRYALTPRSKLSLSGGGYTVQYLGNQTENRNSDSWFARSSVGYNQSALDYLSLNLTTTSSVIDNLISGNLQTGTSDSDQQSLTIGWNRTWSELWSTNLSLGGRRLHTKTANTSRPITFVVPTTGGARPVLSSTLMTFEDTGPGFVGGLTIERKFPRGDLGFSYSRETITTGSLAVSNVNVDSLTLSYVHRLSSLARLTIAGSFEHYVSANDINQFLPASYVDGSFNPITGPEFSCSQGSLVITGSGPSKGGQCELPSSNKLTSNAGNAFVRLDWQLRKRLSTFAVVRYEDRTGDPALFGNPYNRFNVGVGFTYGYDFAP